MAASALDRLAGDERAKVRRITATLAHDVGKYVAMTARNLPRGGVPPERLVAALARDLYELEAGRRASEVFARIVEPLAELVTDPRIDDARAALAELDTLEPEVRRADSAAIERAVHLAKAIEETLRSLARDARETR